MVVAIEAGLARHVLVPYAIRSSKPGGVYAVHAREPQKAAPRLLHLWEASRA